MPRTRTQPTLTQVPSTCSKALGTSSGLHRGRGRAALFHDSAKLSSSAAPGRCAACARASSVGSAPALELSQIITCTPRASWTMLDDLLRKVGVITARLCKLDATINTILLQALPLPITICLVSGKPCLQRCAAEIALRGRGQSKHSAAPRSDGLKACAEVTPINVAVGHAPRPARRRSQLRPTPASRAISSQLHPLMYLINPPPPLGGVYSARHYRPHQTGCRACLHAGAAHGPDFGITLHALAFGLVVHARQQRDGAHIEPLVVESPTMRMPPRTRRCSAP